MPANNFPIPNFAESMSEEKHERLVEQIRTEAKRIAELLKQKQDEDYKSNL